MMSPEFTIQYRKIYFCDHPDCTQQPSTEVTLVGSTLGYVPVCRGHVMWAKQELTKRDAQRRVEEDED